MTIASLDRAPAVPRLARVRVLGGASLWRNAPAVVGELAAGDTPDAALPPPMEAFRALRRALPASTADVPDPASWGEAVAALAIALQRAAGAEVEWSRVAPAGDPGVVLVAIDFEEERAGLEALELAWELLRDAVEGEPVDVPRAVRDLHDLMERERLPEAGRRLMAAARRRGIPVRRAPGSDIVQLGLGCRSRRIDSARDLDSSGSGDADGFLDALFPPGAPTTVPVLAVTGTNGKTTTTRLLAHLFRHAGRRTGFTTTDGVYFQEELVFEGDMTGPMAADMVLANPEVDVAVLETARGGILRAGLGFAACDTAVVLNITPDHLGLRGIHTVEQLAEAKGVLVTAVRPGGYAVLNADDPLVFAMRLRTPGTIALFSLGAPDERPHLAAHVARGGTALCREGDTLVHYRAGTRAPLLTVAEVPLTLGGAAEFQVQNALAAATAGLVTGLLADEVRAGLRTFRPSRETTPGRMNVIPTRGATFIVDYAHNPAAIAALLGLVGRMPARRRIGVLSAPGDRRDDDLREIGRLGRTLDLVIFKEHPDYRRGRAPGAIAAIMRDALLETGFPAARIGTADGEEDAMRQTLAAMGEGDVVAFIADDQTVVDAMLEADAG